MFHVQKHTGQLMPAPYFVQINRYSVSVVGNITISHHVFWNICQGREERRPMAKRDDAGQLGNMDGENRFTGTDWVYSRQEAVERHENIRHISWTIRIIMLGWVYLRIKVVVQIMSSSPWGFQHVTTRSPDTIAIAPQPLRQCGFNIQLATPSYLPAFLLSILQFPAHLSTSS